MRVLVACEFSGVVRDTFIARGHDAMSCDVLPTESVGPHHQGDVLGGILDDGWDLMVAHPPCTFLCNSGVSWLYHKDGSKDEDRWDAMTKGALFFKALLEAPIPRIAVENPVMHGYAKDIIGRSQTQCVQPWQFGDPVAKRTCLWLKGLTPLVPTDVLELPESGRWSNQTPGGWDKTSPSPDRWKIRSVTHQGIADAMADQWGGAVFDVST